MKQITLTNVPLSIVRNGYGYYYPCVEVEHINNKGDKSTLKLSSSCELSDDAWSDLKEYIKKHVPSKQRKISTGKILLKDFDITIMLSPSKYEGEMLLKGKDIQSFSPFTLDAWGMDFYDEMVLSKGTFQPVISDSLFTTIEEVFEL